MEIWKDVVGYEGLYMGSNLGRIIAVKSGKIRKIARDKDGYFQIGLMKNGKRFYPKVHRLVAEAFIANPNSFPIVNHKNEDKSDNRPENLELCTVAYNNSYGSRVRAVLQFDMCEHFVREYPSINEAARKNKIDAKTIYRWCRKIGGVGRGYKWYFGDYATEGKKLWRRI